MSGESDRTTEGLARRAQTSDPGAFEELVRRLRGRLEMWINVRMGPLLRSRLTPDDVLQETLLQAHRSLADFRETGPGSFQRWIFSVAENRLRDLHKYHAAQRRHPAREAQGGPRSSDETALLERLAAREPSPSSGAHRREMLSRLALAIAHLPEPLRDVLVKRALEQRPFREIAEQMQLPAATVPALFARALKGLRHEIQRR